MLKKIYDWMGTKVHSPRATFFLGFLFFIEAIFFIPVDPLLVLYCLEKREKSFWYATIATVASVAGGATAYILGFFLWHTVGPQIIHSNAVNYIVSAETFLYLCQQYKQYAHWAVLILGFSPLPYKAATLSAGFCKIPFLPFIFFSFIARGARFFLIAFILKVWGPQIKKYIDRYFYLLVVLTVVIVVTLVWIIKFKQ